MEASSREFWQFSDQIRLETANLASLSIGDSIWSDPGLAAGRRPEDRRNLDSPAAPSVLGAPDLNAGGWKAGFGGQKLAFTNSSFDRYNNSNSYNNSAGGNLKSGGYFNNNNNNFNGNGEIKNYFNKAISKPASNVGGINSRKKINNNIIDGKASGKKKSNNNDNNGNGAVDKRFKTLPPSEALPRSEAVGGYIFVCNNDTMQENLRRQLFGLPPRYKDSVRAITPGLPLFLYNYSTHQLHGIFEAASFGGTNIDPAAWEDKKCPGESRFPAQDLALDATTTVGVDLGQGFREVDIKKYIKVEKIPGGQLEDSKVLKGVMFNKDVVAPGKMRRKILNRRIILLDCPLEYKKGENQTNAELVKEEDWTCF